MLLVYTSGRKNFPTVAEKTKDWLIKQDLPSENVFFRHVENNSDTVFFKTKAVDKAILEFSLEKGLDITQVLVVDDNPKVLNAFSSQGFSTVLADEKDLINSSRNIREAILLNLHAKENNFENKSFKRAAP